MRKCLKCGYQWLARVKEPKACPDCKSRKWQESDEKEPEAERPEA